jgi:hypothetical protein
VRLAHKKRRGAFCNTPLPFDALFRVGESYIMS